MGIKITFQEEAAERFLTEGKEFFSECWKLLKSAASAGFDDDYWDWAMKTQDEIYHRHDGIGERTFASRMIVTIMVWIEQEGERSYRFPSDYAKGGSVNGVFNDFWKVCKKHLGTAGVLDWSALVCDLSEYRETYHSDLAVGFSRALEDQLAFMCKCYREAKKAEEESAPAEKSA